jgi:hypothetical protein
MFPPLKTKRRAGSEQLHVDGKATKISLLDFWQWAGSDLIGNTARGIFAEYLVATAVGMAAEVRNEWEECDVRLGDIKIEVKSAAYPQSWFQRSLSTISFSIRPSRKWSSETGELAIDPKRHSDLYVFCLLAHKQKETLDPLNLHQWIFYILPTEALNIRYKEAKTIGLSTLLKLNPSVAKYEELASCILKCVSNLKSNTTE